MNQHLLNLVVTLCEVTSGLADVIFFISDIQLLGTIRIILFLKIDTRSPSTQSLGDLQKCFLADLEEWRDQRNHYRIFSLVFGVFLKNKKTREKTCFKTLVFQNEKLMSQSATKRKKNYFAVLKNSSVYSRIPSFNNVSASGVKALVSRRICP